MLRGVSLEIAGGGVSCIIGSNGSGKSTLLSILAGLVKPDGGQVLFQGKPVDGSALRQIGFVPQSDSLFADLTVKDNLAFWAAAAKTSLQQVLGIQAVRQLQLEPMLNKKVGELSGGMRRRVAVAAALVGKPSLLILDEPFAGLDLFHKDQLTWQLRTLCVGGVTILYTSHNADEIVPLSDTVYLLHEGRIALHTAADSLPKDNIALHAYLLNLIKGETAK